jgi:hypothetical protein
MKLLFVQNETAIKFNMIIIKYLTISSEQFEIDAKFVGRERRERSEAGKLRLGVCGPPRPPEAVG